MAARSALDASAILALVHQEPGSERVTEALALGAAMSAVNFSEVVAKLAEAGMTHREIHEVLDSLQIEVVPFDTVSAYEAGLLRPATRHLGLSLGDRACLALARLLGVPALTTDRAWSDLPLGVPVQVIR